MCGPGESSECRRRLGECCEFPGEGHDAALARGSRRACTTNAGTTAYETGGRRLTRPAVGAGYAGLVDENYKKLFAFPRMVEDLLRGFAARGWAGKLEFSTLRKVPAEYVSDALLKRHGDTVWQVRFRDGRHLLVVLEFQSREDPRMALRILVYTSLLYQELFRNEAPVLDAGGRLPAVLPVVVYNGAARWTAAGEVSDLVQPVDGELVPYRPSQRYHVLDERHVGDEDLPRPESGDGGGSTGEDRNAVGPRPGGGDAPGVVAQPGGRRAASRVHRIGYAGSRSG